MTVEQFLLRMEYGQFSCPDRISPARWAGMLAWYEFNYRDDEIMDYLNNHGQ